MLLTQQERGTMEPRELWNLCVKATTVAVRAPYTADDRAECVADIMGEIIALVASEPTGRTGRPVDVLAYIDRVLSAQNVRQSASMPMRSDPRVRFVALRNRAANWRRAREHARELASLAKGKTGATKKADAPLPAQYLRYVSAGARQSIAASRASAERACELLGVPSGHTKRTEVALTAMITRTVEVTTPSAPFCMLYQWVRECTAEVAAAELGMSHDNYRVKSSRAAKLLRQNFTQVELLTVLCGRPIKRADEWMFALTDASRDAHGRTPILADAPGAPNWREGTDAGAWPERATTAHAAREASRVTWRRAAPKSAAQRRTAALNGHDPSEAEAEARLALGTALGGIRGRMPKNATGRTAGKAPERYASRSVRLGK